jgi:phospholipid/cholesterol/gamma-HCH transport system substrate-binding protein
MPSRYFVVGLFISAGLALFTLGIFLIGNRHEAFSHHVLLYANLPNLDGIEKGSKVQVSGMDAGQVTKIEVPASPESPFRVQMRINEELHGLVRTDSLVTVDTQGVVGETFLTIHPGSSGAAEVPANSTLQSKAPVSISDLLTHGLDVMNDADATMKEVKGKLNTALDGVTGTVGNANDLLVGLKEGRGPAGMFLRDDKMAAQIRDTVSSVQSTTATLNQASARVNGLVEDLEKHQLAQKLDDTMTQIHSASTQANITLQELHQSLGQALGPDTNGVSAGLNISETLTNLNAATGNMAEDTEALKHNLFFKGFFDHRGYYNLTSMSPQDYRRNRLLVNSNDHRSWLPADHLFQREPDGSEVLTSEGRKVIDSAIAASGDSVFRYPVVVEGYADAADPADQLALSYARAQLVRVYLQARFPFEAKRLGVMPLSATPPPGLGHESWSGVCVLVAMKMQ